MASTILPSIQEMFPDHLLSKENQTSSKSPASTILRSSEASKLASCDYQSASGSVGRSQCSSPHSPPVRQTYPGTALSTTPLPKHAESTTSGKRSLPKDDCLHSYDHSCSDLSSGSIIRTVHSRNPSASAAISRSAHRQEVAAQMNFPPPSSSIHLLHHSNMQRRPPVCSEDNTSHDHYQRPYSSQNIHPHEMSYCSQSRSPPCGPRVHVPYPYPPRPGSSERAPTGQFYHQIEDEELEGEDYDDAHLENKVNISSTSSTRKHVCPTCFKRFNRPSSLKIHVNTHTGATPFRCPWPNCGREFNVNSNMRRHYRNHLTPSRSQGIFPLPPPPTATGHLNQVPALVPANTSGIIHDFTPPPSRSHQHAPNRSPESSPRFAAPHQNPNGPNSDHFSVDQAKYRQRSHVHSLSAGSELYNVYHDQYHRSGGQGRGRDRPMLSNPQFIAEIRGNHSRDSPRDHWETSRPSSSRANPHYRTSSSTRRTTPPSSPMTHSSASEAANSDVDMDVDGEDVLDRHPRSFSRSQYSCPSNPKVRTSDRHHPYEHSVARRHRPAPLSFDQGSMEIDPSSAYPTPTSKHSADGVDINPASRRSLSPAGSSFRSSSPSPSLSTSSTRSLSRSLSRERQTEDSRSSFKYNSSKAHIQSAHVSTMVRSAFA